jgi:hypothetical protein
MNYNILEEQLQPDFIAANSEQFNVYRTDFLRRNPEYEYLVSAPTVRLASDYPDVFSMTKDLRSVARHAHDLVAMAAEVRERFEYEENRKLRVAMITEIMDRFEKYLPTDEYLSKMPYWGARSTLRWPSKLDERFVLEEVFCKPWKGVPAIVPWRSYRTMRHCVRLLRLFPYTRSGDVFLSLSYTVQGKRQGYNLRSDLAKIVDLSGYRFWIVTHQNIGP